MPALLDGHSTLTPRVARSSLVLRDFWVFRKISCKKLSIVQSPRCHQISKEAQERVALTSEALHYCFVWHLVSARGFECLGLTIGHC